jgi:hypothetical protein
LANGAPSLSVNGKAISVIPAGILDKVISFTFRNARVKMSTFTWEANEARETWIVAGPGPVAGLGKTTIVACGVGVRVGATVEAWVFVPVAVGVDVSLKVKVGVIVGIDETVKVKVWWKPGSP